MEQTAQNSRELFRWGGVDREKLVAVILRPHLKISLKEAFKL